jgi:penicillin-binding protein 1B
MQQEQDETPDRRSSILRLIRRTVRVVLPLIGIASGTAFLFLYLHYSRIIDRRLGGEVFQRTARIYAAPFPVYTGQSITLGAVTERLWRAGYKVKDTAPSDAGFFEVSGSRLTVIPRIGSPFLIDFQAGHIAHILATNRGEVSETFLPPELVTTLYNEKRQKRRILEYEEIPKTVEQSVLAAEDQRFYHHPGLDPIRIVGSLLADLRRTDRLEGGSTITQQLAGNFFLDRRERTLSRKLREAFIALLLEWRLTKKQILVMYLNEVYLGQRGSFSIHGFGEAAAAFFGKDLQQLTLEETATIAGLIPSPNSYAPQVHPDRARVRRNLVLSAMRDARFISQDAYRKASDSAIELAPIRVDASDAPYFVDYLREQLQRDFTEEALTNDGLKIYTTLDPDLQNAAVEAVEKGGTLIDQQINARNERTKSQPAEGPAQAALIVVDPHTGAIRAMVGGRDYETSQYNRIANAYRQPGSIFKPFVYAAAYETSFGSIRDFGGRFITPATEVVDEPSTFSYANGRTYKPNNFHQSYNGTVTLRIALQKSLNVPAVKIAERIGYDRVALFAKRAGLNARMLPYPSIALGAFEVTPLELTGAYTIFANDGIREEPYAVSEVQASDGEVLKTYGSRAKAVIRPELAFLMTYLMEGVINNGTGAGVRARGFTLPAAGKTGTSRDGWFAGYTKDLLAIAWAGYDDNHDIDLEGARSALPIWTEFMLRASKIYPPRNLDALSFKPPAGIEFSAVCTGFQEAFILGTAPRFSCGPPAIVPVIQHSVGVLSRLPRFLFGRKK